MYIKANDRKELLEWANDFLKTYDLTPDEDENRLTNLEQTGNSLALQVIFILS